jgi:hypothetical protein
MSRIRSVHPGFFRDENLVPCSAFARLLYIGLGVEADDKGIFEWKPVQLKMSIFPGDNVDMPSLLAELVQAGNVRPFEHGGKRYGAIRNFRKYQKPKTPNDIHPMPDEVADYVAFPRIGEKSADEPITFPRERENAFQMEDGGEGEDGDTSPPSVPEPVGAGVDFEDLLETYPRAPGDQERKAKAAFERIAVADRHSVIAAAQRVARHHAQDCEARGRTLEEGERFLSHLHNWLSSGQWRDADKLHVKGEPSADLAVVVQGTSDFAALERLRQKTIPVFGDRGTITVPKAELERARAEAVH